MEFFTQVITILKTLVIALGAGLAVWELSISWKGDNPGTKSQDIKHVMLYFRR